MIPDAVGEARGYSCYPRHLCEEQLPLPSSSSSSSSGNGKTTGMPGEEGRWSWQALSHCHKTPTTSTAAQESSALTALFILQIQTLNATHILLSAPPPRQLSPSTWPLLSPAQTPTHLMGPTVEGGKSIFRHPETMQGPEVTHSHCGMSADEFPFTRPRTHATASMCAHKHTRSSRVCERACEP